MQVRRVTAGGLLGLRTPEALDAALGMVSCVGDEQFGDRAIEQLNRFLPVGWWTVYRLRDGASPAWHFGGTVLSHEVITHAWSRYRDGGLWRHDHAHAPVRDAADAVDADGIALTHVHASELGGTHQAQIYRAFGLTERVSLVRRQAEGSRLCVNLYRGDGMPGFRDDELDALACIGDLAVRAVENQLKVARAPTNDPTNDATSDPTVAPKSGPLDGLPRREREVCERLLQGLTHDGIAADLQVSPTTVRTYRDRAFERLGIHHRSQLFALMLGTRRPD